MRTEFPTPLAAVLLTGLYLSAYLMASLADLWTTDLAIAAGGSEGNAMLTEAGAYLSLRAWLVTAAGAAIMASVFLFAVLRGWRVSQYWLDRPVRSFLHSFYINPWAKSVADRAALHLLSYALAFVLLRFLAAVNNLAIAAGTHGPIGIVIERMRHVLPPAAAFLTVVCSLYVVLAVLLAPASARLIRRWYRDAPPAVTDC